jgi:hypothetical protein
MEIIAISGEPGCRHELLARLAAERLGCELIGEAELEKKISTQFGDRSQFPGRAWNAVAAAAVASAGTSTGGDAPYLILCFPGAEALFGDLHGLFRFHVVAPERIRLRNLMAERGIDRLAAKAWLRKMAAEQLELRKRRFGRKSGGMTQFDVVANEQAFEPAATLELLMAALKSRLAPEALTPAEAEQARFGLQERLARCGIAMPDRTGAEGKAFGHPSEQVFANLLDLYRIAWDYEPRSFPLQWDKDGKVSEAFTPDFYLPEFDLYVELTTMKQAHVTKKNRKIRLLRAIYPHVNIQIFYQKDVQELLANRRLPEGLVR